jgi:2-polyprenyl-3-methyl-5-hydroxy-6-metoxy-1,4-benzoquinol methylase
MSSDRKTQDPVNQPTLQLAEKMGILRFGVLKNLEWYEDPRRLLFSMARYKFVAKMLSGCTNVLEVGCGDAFCAPIVLQEVGKLTVTDFDPVFIEDARERKLESWAYDARVHDFLTGPLPGEFDAAYSLDVLEHIEADKERVLLDNVVASLAPNGVMIIGMPSLESQLYASPGSKAGHVNCKSAPELKQLCGSYFDNVFMFSMNDEVVHTGYHKMAHYIMALCCGPRSRR